MNTHFVSCIINYTIWKKKVFYTMRKICTTGNYIYALFNTIIELENYAITEVYGITISEGNNVVTVEDISDDYDFALKLFDMIVEGELYPEHLKDVVEDYLS